MYRLTTHPKISLGDHGVLTTQNSKLLCSRPLVVESVFHDALAIRARVAHRVRQRG